MKKPNIVIRFVAGGFAFGVLFPLFAILFDLHWNDLSLSVTHIRKLHVKYPIHFIIDSAPLVISLVALIVGKKISVTGKKARSVIEQQVDELLLKNEELQVLEEELRQNNEELHTLNENNDEQKKIIEENERRLSTIIENQGEGFALVSHDGVFRFTNPVACEIFNVPTDGLIGKNFRDFFDKSQWNGILEQIEKRKTGIKSSYELVINNSGQDKKYLQVTSTPYYNEDKTISSSIVVFRDNTQMKNAELKIKKQNQELHKYFTAIEQSSAIIVITDIIGNIEYVNSKFEIITGFNLKEVLGKNPRILKSGKTPEYIYPQLWNTITNGRVWQGEFINEKKNGEEYLEKASITPVKDDNGEIINYLAIKEDITQLKKAEQEIKDNNERLYTIVNSVQTGILIIDAEDFRIKYVNQTARNIIGKSNIELHGKHCCEIFSTPKYNDCPISKSGKSVNNMEMHILNKHNQEIQILKTIVPIKLNGKKHYLESFIDISELKNAERLIREKNEQQQILINNLPAYIYFKDINLKYLLVNDSFAKILGLPVNEIIGKTDNELSSSEVGDIYQGLDKDIIRSHKPVLNFEAKHTDLQGNEYWASTSKVPHYGEDGIVKGIIGIVQDITQRKRNEQIIVEKTRQFENTINSLEDIYFKTDINGKLLQASPSICKLLKYPNLDVIFQNDIFDSFFKDPGAKKEMIDTILETGRINNFSLKLKDKDGQELYGEANAVVWYDKNNSPMGVEGIIRNVSDRVKFEEKLSRLNQNLVQSLETMQEQKIIIERAHKDITESINYAKTIQQSLLSSNEIIKNNLNDYFILYLPKDIVSGDFYYVNRINENIIIAAADCTGHGVAGAFLTILGITYLHQIVIQDNINNMGNVLNILRERFKKTFSAFGAHSYNGLDIALCSLDKQSKRIQYAGANNPLWLIRRGKITEYKATRNPIGVYPKENKFVNNEIQLEDNDIIYLFSDGYIDQYSMEYKAKYKKRKFSELILRIYHLPMEKQKQILSDTLMQWREDTKQTDDILVFAFKV